VAFQSLLASFQSPLQQLLNLYGDVQRLRGDMARLDDVLKYDQDPSAATDAVSSSLTPLEGHVEIRGITFGYSPLDPPLIQDFSLTLTPGARVALVGKSGCGKSTLSKLIMGIYAPWSGDILFDSKPRTSWPRDTIVSSLAYVDQDIFLFDGTVHANLTMWNDAIPSAQVIRAAKDAQIHDVIAARTGGYASRVEEGGRNFSGGQAQRLEIARALVGNPRILVLDEATSALDPITEQRIDDAVRRRGITTIIVAHRLSTIRDCDEIIVLDRGSVVQRGTHEQLIREDGMYARLIAAE
jgi:ABC-type bacteriocin/lantibiotic exporter with double-glycine peptidase domain